MFVNFLDEILQSCLISVACVVGPSVNPLQNMGTQP
jgi:hypothetical protein